MRNYAVAFPGQGAQYINMGKDIYVHNKIVRDTFEEASTILGYDLCKLCFEASIDKLSRMDLVQPAILTTSVAGFRVFMQNVDQEPSFLLGHSLGEISALVCSGAINFSDGVKIVDKRGRLMGSKCIEKGYMIAIMGLSMHIVEEICKKISHRGHMVEISNINSEEQIVLSGHEGAVDEAVKYLEASGGRTLKVNTGNPFHSSLMNIVKSDLLIELEKYTYYEFQYPVISNLNALCYEHPTDIPKNLSEQIAKTVRWKESIEYVVGQGIHTIIEMKPQTIIRNLLMTNDLGIDVYSDDDCMDKKYIKSITMEICNPFNNTKESKKNLIQRCISTAVSTENFNYRNEEYLEQVINPYKQLISNQREIADDGYEPGYEDMKMALDLLLQILKGKRICLDQQRELIKDILFETGLFDLFDCYLEG